MGIPAAHNAFELASLVPEKARCKESEARLLEGRLESILSEIDAEISRLEQARQLLGAVVEPQGGPGRLPKAVGATPANPKRRSAR
jgi:hypothetical protein